MGGHRRGNASSPCFYWLCAPLLQLVKPMAKLQKQSKSGALRRTNMCFWILNVFKLLYKVSQSTSLMIYG